MRRSLFVLLAVSAWSACGRAQPGGACGDDNLLAGRSPVDWREVYRPDTITDGAMARDGDPELGDRSAVLAGERAVVDYDLGSERQVTAAMLQGSAAGRFVVEMSTDRLLWTRVLGAEPRAGAGLRTSMRKGLDGRGRYVRLRAEGAGAAGVTELQLFCRAPPALPVTIAAAGPVPGPAEVAKAQSRHTLLLLLPAGLALALLFAAPASRRRARLALVLAAAAFALALVFAATQLTLGTAAACGGTLALLAAGVGSLRSVRPAGERGPFRSAAGAAAALLVGVAAMAYSNYGRFGGYWSVHYHDALHYVLGAKYAPELRYDGLYACLLEAHSAEQRWSGAMPSAVRDLRDDRLRSAGETAARGGCRGRFSDARWLAFRRDAAFFMGQLSPRAWVAVFADHGYNATPVWTWLFRPLLSRAPLTTGSLAGLAHLDEAAYALMALVLVWGWGARRAALAAMLFGGGFPWIYLWTGGGVGRSLWLLALAAALALSARRRFVAGGIALGVAGALQLFPALFLAGPLVLAVRRRGDPEVAAARTLVVAATLTGVALVLCSLQVAGLPLWLDFVHNTVRQAASGSANRIGAAVIAVLLGNGGFLGSAFAAVALGLWLWAALRARDGVRLLSLSVLVPVFAVRLSSYYLALVVALVPLFDTWRRVALAVLALLALPHAVALLAPGEPGPGAYAVMSIGIVGLGAALCVLEARAGRATLPG